MGKLIDNKAKYELSLLLTDAKTRETLYVHSALHSAFLAAQQVDSVSIQQLEKKAQPGSETAEIGDVFIDIVIDLVITGVGGKLLGEGLEKVLRPLIRSKQAYYLFPDPPKQRPTTRKWGPVKPAKPTIEAIKKAQSLVGTKLDPQFTVAVDSEDFGAYKAVPLAIGTALLAEVSKRAVDKVNLASTSPAPNDTRRGDAASVQVLRSAENLFLTQTSAIESCYGQLDSALKYTDIDIDLANEWRAFLQNNRAEGTDDTTLQWYRDHLFRYYEFTIWAHSTDLATLSSVREKYNYSPMSETRVDQYLRDISEWELKEQTSERTVYRYPNVGTSKPDGRMGGAPVERVVNIPKEKLDYWINRFPYDFGDINGPTVLEHFKGFYSSYKSDRDKVAMRVMAYQYVLKLFEHCDSSIKYSFRKLRDHQALLRAADLAQP